MLRLILKDFAIQRKTILYLLLFSAAFVLLLGGRMNQAEMLLLPMLFGLTYGFAGRALYEDEKNNVARLLVSMPITKRDIVYARYMSVFIFTIAAGVMYWFFCLIAGFIQAEAALLKAGSLFVFMASIILMFSVYLPVVFRFGYGKAGWVGILLLGVIVGAVNAIMSVTDINISGTLTNASNSAILQGIITVLVTLGLYVASMQLSASLYRKRNIF